MLEEILLLVGYLFIGLLCAFVADTTCEFERPLPGEAYVLIVVTWPLFMLYIIGAFSFFAMKHFVEKIK